MSSDSTTAQLNAIIARIKTYVSPTLGKSAGQLTSNRVYAWQAPTKADFPHIIVRKQNGATDPEVNDLKEMFEAHATCVTHQRINNEINAEELADLVEQALLSWKESSSALGLSYGVTSARDPEPTDTSSDSDIIRVLVVVQCAAWPRRLTAALT